MDENTVQSEISPLEKDNHCMISPKMRTLEQSNSQQQEGQWWLWEGSRRKNEELFTVDRISVLQDEKVLRVNCILKMVQVITFILSFYHSLILSIIQL
jgi:hypothetical protein